MGTPWLRPGWLASMSKWSFSVSPPVSRTDPRIDMPLIFSLYRLGTGMYVGQPKV